MLKKSFKTLFKLMAQVKKSRTQVSFLTVKHLLGFFSPALSAQILTSSRRVQPQLSKQNLSAGFSSSLPPSAAVPYLQHQYLLLCFLQLLLGCVQRAIQATFLCRQPHRALLRLQLLTFNLMKNVTMDM